MSVYPSCGFTSANVTASPPLPPRYVAYNDILDENDFNIPVFVSVVYFVAFTLVLRVVTYLILRYARKPAHH